MSGRREPAESAGPGRRRPARERILRAAARRFYQEGVTATGIDTITAEAGVAKMSLYNNFSSKADLVLALALIHHLAIGKNIPFSGMADFFQQLGHYLVIEFIPKDDEKIRFMLQQKKDVYQDYTEENFLAVFSGRYKLLDRQVVGTSKRTLYLMESYAV